MSKYRTVFILILLVIGNMFYSWYVRHLRSEQSIINPNTQRITINTRTRSIKIKQLNRKEETLHGVRDTSFIIVDGKVTEVKIKSKGLIFEPAITTQVTSNQELRAGLDIQVLFYKKLGIILGTTVTPFHMLDAQGHAGLSYDLMSNMAVTVGMNTKKDLFVGLKVNL